ncbi:MAG: divergent PAP2 family protein [Candidatus Omnitrophica bacterium]|nr:divergent PAP2 family protein [Candidatus Omnitrophota bacterium]
MLPALVEFSKNQAVWTGALAWLLAQTLKVLLGAVREKRFNFMWFVGTGGMPSSHAAGITALASTIGLYAGFNTPIFALALFFTIVVLFDAQGVRRASGTQAQILNRILDDIYWKKKIQEDRLKELLGHTPIEVFAGVAIGVFVSLLCYKGV